MTGSDALAAAAAEFAALTGPASLEGTVQVDLGGDGAGSAHAVFAAGLLVDVGLGPAERPDALVSLSVEDARAVLTGALDPSVAFIRGQLKVSGSMAVVLDLLALAATGPARTGRERIARLVDA